jgi:hypothetical protein
MSSIPQPCFSLANFVTFCRQSRLVRCIGTDADNIRPAQRALQWFKNTNLLAVLLPVPAHPDVAEETLRTLLPALYRGGALSWNPTVNKMTGLALKNLMAWDETLFQRVCGDVLSVGMIRRPGSAKSKHTANREERPAPDFKSASSADDKDARVTSSTSKDRDADTMARMMSNLTAEDIAGANKAQPAFAVPTGRPKRPPTMAPVDHSAGGLGAKPSVSAVPSMGGKRIRWLRNRLILCSIDFY